MATRANVALMGRSGAGKTMVAKLLVTDFGYHRCSPGDICRQVCRIIFGGEDREVMNWVTDLLKQIDDMVWLKAALSNAPADRPLVYDSMRFRGDYEYLTSLGFLPWRVESPQEVRHARMRERGQVFSAESDEDHALETELLNYSQVALIVNGLEVTSDGLRQRVTELMSDRTS